MNYFEDKVTAIYFTETRDYFYSDVLSSYKSSSYRSCIISLWNVFLYDLEKKVIYLNNITDESEKEIRDKLQRFINKFDVIRAEKKLGEEMTLIKEIAQTGLISSSEYDGCIITLKQERNICAHPIVEDGMIYCTNPHIVRGLIEEILKIIIRKPIYLKCQHNEIFRAISDNHRDYNNFSMSELNNIAFGSAGFTLLKNRYYKHFQEIQAVKYFEILFTFIFCKNDNESQTNRKANFIELLHFTTEFSKLIKESIHNNLNTFVETKIFKILEEDGIIDLFTLFSLRFIDISYTLNQNPQYSPFIKHKATKFDNLKLIEEVILDGNNFKERFQNRHKLFPSENAFPFYLLKLIEDYYVNLGFKDITKSINKHAIHLYSCSKKHDVAHKRFQEYIAPRLEQQKFEFEDIQQLVRCSEENKNVLERYMALRDHEIIAGYIKVNLKINDQQQLEILENKFFKDNLCITTTRAT